MKLALVLTACLLSSGVFTKEIGKAADPKALALSIQTCSGLGNCQQEQAGIAIDYGYVCNDPRNCYTVSEFIHFDNQDQKMLNVILINQIPNAGDYAGWGVTVNGNAVNMNYGPSNGARLYITACTTF